MVGDWKGYVGKIFPISRQALPNTARLDTEGLEIYWCSSKIKEDYPKFKNL